MRVVAELEEKPEITVVIPTYNKVDQLYQTILSLKAQTLERDRFEIIVVDDGGSDDAHEVVCNFVKHLNVRYVWQCNRGFRAGKARNIGTIMAEAPYILYIDAGVLPYSNCLELHLAHHKLKPKTVAIGYVYGFERDFTSVKSIVDAYRDEGADKLISTLRLHGLCDIRELQYQQLGDQLYQWPAPFDIFWTCHVSVERAEVINAGLFDEDFNTWGGEDVDLGVRLHQNQNSFWLLRDAASCHLPEPFDVDEKKRLSTIAGKRIHAKYGLYTTHFYGINTTDAKFSLNAAIASANIL